MVATIGLPPGAVAGDAGDHEDWLRRARPQLGTLVDIGAWAPASANRERQPRATYAARPVAAAFERIAAIETSLSRFIATSAIARFNAAPAGARITVDADAACVMAEADRLRCASEGLFDISLGTGPAAWRLVGRTLCKLDAAVTLDLGGIGKGFAVDAAIEALQQHGAVGGWVNAGGDLRVFGPLSVPIDLRDEVEGGVRRFATLGDGAFATSRLAPGNGTAAGVNAVQALTIGGAPTGGWPTSARACSRTSFSV